MKVVGHRAVAGQPLRDAGILQRTVRRLRGEALVPRGLYRFATHEEADTWMMRTIARTHARRSSRTSSASVAR
jgi:hypothetical protein